MQKNLKRKLDLQKVAENVIINGEKEDKVFKLKFISLIFKDIK